MTHLVKSLLCRHEDLSLILVCTHTHTHTHTPGAAAYYCAVIIPVWEIETGGTLVLNGQSVQPNQ